MSTARETRMTAQPALIAPAGAELAVGEQQAAKGSFQVAAPDKRVLPKTVLFMPEGSVLAHVGRSLSIASHLRAAELDVRFASAGKHAERIAEAGWPVEPVFTHSREQLLSRLRTGGSAFDERQLLRYVKSEITALEKHQPELVVGDFRPSLSISAALCGIPYVCVTNLVWTRYCGFQVEPPDSWLLTRLLGRRVLGLARPAVEQLVFAAYATPFNRVRRRYGLSPVRDLRDAMCSETLNLVVDAPELFPPADDMPSHFVMVGPVAWEPDLPEPDCLDRLDPDRRTVYLTMGSTGPLEQIGNIVEVLLGMGVQVVCTGGERAQEFLGDRPDLYMMTYAPGSSLCRAADVVLCHAGNGTVYQALTNAAPVACLAEFHDQEFNMQRVEALGLGLRLRPNGSLAHEVKSGVGALLDDPSYHERAAAFAEKLSRWDGAAAAARYIAVLARKGALAESA